jgi:hypothetical protein
MSKGSSLANRALVFLHKPLLNAQCMVTMPTLNLAQLVPILILLLKPKANSFQLEMLLSPQISSETCLKDYRVTHLK